MIVSREAIRLWVNRFGRHFADSIKRERPDCADKWHLDEVVVMIHGEKFWLWRAVDANGDVLDILVLKHRSAKAAKRFLTRLVARFGQPRVIVTDKLRSYIKPIKTLAPDADHRAHEGLNNRMKAHTGQPEKERKSWAGSNRLGTPNNFSLHMIKSTQSSTRALSTVRQLVPPCQIRRFRSVEKLCR